MLTSAEQRDETVVDEVPIDQNPGKALSDKIPVTVRVRWKLLIGGDHHTIIPPTSNHTTWILGVQPNETALRKVHAEVGKALKMRVPLHVVNMLHDDERLIRDQDKKRLQDRGILSEIFRRPLFDHGVVDVTTGKNQTIRGMKAFQENFYPAFNTVPYTTAFYCHCMAGKSRSFIETITFLSFYPDKDKNKLFDFSNWPEDMVAKIPQDLQDRLKNNPAFSDLAEFVKLQRPDVKPIWKMDGDQAGFLGLMSLEKWAGPDAANSMATRVKGRLYKDAQNIGLMLKAPVDRGFRDEQDLAEQYEKFIIAYKTFQERRSVNLLMAMVVPIENEVVDGVYNQIEVFDANFAKLKPSAQARCAILMQKLEDAGIAWCPANSRVAKDYARQVVLNGAGKLTIGDQVELLRTFGAFPGGISYDSVVNQALGSRLNVIGRIKRALVGGGVNRHNVGIQLAELQHIAAQRGIKIAAIENALSGNKLSKAEKQAYQVHLSKLTTNQGTIVDSMVVLEHEVKKKATLDEKEALRQFKTWFYAVKNRLSPEDKQRLVQQFMFDSKTHNPGNPERLAVVLGACTQNDLGGEANPESLYNKLLVQYPRTSNTLLANLIAYLPAKHGPRWIYAKPNKDRQKREGERGIQQERKVDTSPGGPEM